MAFDGPTPFDGDPAYMYAHEVEGQAPAKVRRALARAFSAVVEGDYVEVDEGVWAWCAAEMVATAIGRPARARMPEPFATAAACVPQAPGLIARALEALEVVTDAERSEVAELWKESGEGTLRKHVAPLRARLRKGVAATPKREKHKGREPSTTRKLQPGDVLAIPANEATYYLLVYVGKFLPIYGHALGAFMGTHRAAAPGPERPPPRLPRLICVGSVGKDWVHVGSVPALLSLFPSQPEYFHAKVNFPDDPRIGPFGSAERPDAYASEGSRADIVDYSGPGETCVLRHLSEREAASLGLLDRDFTNVYDADELANALAALTRS